MEGDIVLNKTHMMAGLAVVSILVGSLLVNNVILAQTGGGEYDPWIDTNDDGEIDTDDLYLLANDYGTSGTPINKTALLLELQTKVDSLNASVLELQTRTDSLNTTVVHLDETVAYLNSTQGLGSPDYDSGWTPMSGKETKTFTHDFNKPASELLIYIIGSHTLYPIHQMWYGGNEVIWPSGDRYFGGVYWYSTSNNSIQVYNLADEPQNYYQNIRVMIWIIQEPPT